MNYSLSHTPYKQIPIAKSNYFTPGTEASFDSTRVQSIASARGYENWERLDKDIDYMKYNLSLCMNKRMPKFDYDLPLIGDNKTTEIDEREKMNLEYSDNYIQKSSKNYHKKQFVSDERSILLKRCQEDLERDGVILDPRFKDLVLLKNLINFLSQR